MRRIWVQGILLLVLLLTVSGTVSAQPQLITATGEYTMGEGETPAAAKERARLEAMRSATEQAGIYLESSSVVKDMQLTQDEVHTMAGSVLQVQSASYTKKLAADNDSITFTAQITALVDPVDVTALRQRLQDKSVKEEYERLQQSYAKTQQEYERLQAEVKELKNQLSEVEAPAQKTEIQKEIARNEEQVAASGWLAEGNRLLWKRNYYGAVDAYTQAIRVMPSSADAYIGRAQAHKGKGETSLAMADFTKAVELAPEAAAGWLGRGRLYEEQRLYAEAVADYTQGIAADPSRAASYLSRAELYRQRQDAASALSDYRTAISLDDSLADAWYGAAKCQEALGDKEAAISGYTNYLSRADKKSYSYKLLDAKKRLNFLQGKPDQEE